MKILIVHYSDDNFGDMLICNCFEQILRVVLENLGMEQDTCEISSMGLKHPDLKRVSEAQLICFAGGGLFGLSYLDFYEYLKQILETADQCHIPVIFSSMGVNNMDATNENDQRLKELLRMPCIRAISVRENPELFQDYAGDIQLQIKQVCDPAVWTKYVYSSVVAPVLEQKKQRKKKIVGINVVRSGLFADNGKKWYLKQEIEYLSTLKDLLEKEGYECKFYTNGSTFDHNTMLYLEHQCAVPENQIISVDTTKELVETIASFDMVAAIRMHSSIISYSMDIPVVNLVWNDKIPHFYEAIHRKEGAIYQEDWNAKKVYETLCQVEQGENYQADPEYLMSLYGYLFEAVRNVLGKETNREAYSFETVVAKLKSLDLSDEKDILDMKVKIYRGEDRYYHQFMSLREKEAEIKEFEKTCKSLEKQNKDLKNQNQKLQDKMNRIEQKFPIRVYRKFQKTIRKVKKL